MRHRLPQSVRPREIDLHFDLDPADAAFRGEARYGLELERRARRIELHAADLRLSKVAVRVGGERIRARVEPHPESERVVLRFDRLLPAGSLDLELAFRGRVRRDLRGLYRSVDAATPWLATQLCPTDARRFFPCFDEPGIKARYRIRVTAPRGLTVLSNAPIESVEERLADRPDRQVVRFAWTPPLSSYLVAVAVGPFVASPPRHCGATEIRVVTLPGRSDLAAFAAEAAVESLARLERWFDLPHPYPKLDLVALPDFAFGAMENAGAVFFRDSLLLVDASSASSEVRKSAAETIAHELSHMWFGNLVTMAWWNDLWLNESFATWMAYEIVHDWRPEWRIRADFMRRREHALVADALASSHPIAPRIRSADEALENFDAITYAKGASVLRMLEGHLGRETFRDGIRRYVRRHREGAATAADLWAALGEASALPIESIVSPWVGQTGVPLVRVRRRDRRGRARLALEQERFLMLPARSASQDRPARWPIPWMAHLGHGARKADLRHLLTRRRDDLPCPEPPADWLYGNADEVGFFRVDHAAQEREALLAHLPQLSALERMGLVGDQWALARAGRLPIGALLDLLAALGDEPDADVLSVVEDVLGGLARRLAPARGPETERALQRWIARHFAAPLERLGLDPRAGEDEPTARRRARLLAIVGLVAQDESVRRACVERCDAHLDSGAPLPPELADEIVRIAAGGGGARLHARLRGGARSAKTPEQRRRMLFALAEFDAPRLVRASLDAALDAGLAPAVDRAGLWGAMISRPATAVATWERLQRAWPRLERELPPIPLARLAAATAEALPTTHGPAIRRFFDAHPLTAGRRVLRQILEELRIARRFEEQAGEAFEARLALD